MGPIRSAAPAIAVLVALALPARIALAHGSGAPPPSLPGALAGWSTDPLVWAGTLLAATTYLFAVRKVNRAHPRVPVPRWRISAWLAGVGSILVALASPIDTYAGDLLSVHMVQHLLLAMVAPPLLALGAPITLLLRATSQRTRQRLVLPILHARLTRLIASPLVAWSVFAIGMFLTHFSPLYDAALEDHSLHVVEHVAYLAIGLLFWWPIVASDPVPRRMGYPARLAYVVLQMPVNAAVGLIIYFAPGVIYPHYATIARTWGPDALTDQKVGGAVMWGAGDLLLLAAVPLIIAAWMRAEDRLSARSDARIRAATRAAALAHVGSRSAPG